MENRFTVIALVLMSINESFSLKGTEEEYDSSLKVYYTPQIMVQQNVKLNCCRQYYSDKLDKNIFERINLMYDRAMKEYKFDELKTWWDRSKRGKREAAKLSRNRPTALWMRRKSSEKRNGKRGNVRRHTRRFESSHSPGIKTQQKRLNNTGDSVKRRMDFNRDKDKIVKLKRSVDYSREQEAIQRLKRSVEKDQIQQFESAASYEWLDADYFTENSADNQALDTLYMVKRSADSDQAKEESTQGSGDQISTTGTKKTDRSSDNDQPEKESAQKQEHNVQVQTSTSLQNRPQASSGNDQVQEESPQKQEHTVQTSTTSLLNKTHTKLDPDIQIPSETYQNRTQIENNQSSGQSSDTNSTTSSSKSIERHADKGFNDEKTFGNDKKQSIFNSDDYTDITQSSNSSSYLTTRKSHRIVNKIPASKLQGNKNAVDWVKQNQGLFSVISAPKRLCPSGQRLHRGRCLTVH